MQTPLQLDFWLQSYKGFVNAENNTKQRNFNTVFANFSKQHRRHPTHSSWSCHICVNQEHDKDTSIMAQAIPIGTWVEWSN